MTVGIHLCHGNYRSTRFAQGGYESVADVLFNELAVDAYFLGYEDERSDDFSPLRLAPKNETVVWGLVSAKIAALEPVHALAGRIDKAAAYVDLDQLCLSPQCGLSSTAEGNELKYDDHWAKLRRVVETARHV